MNTLQRTENDVVLIPGLLWRRPVRLRRIRPEAFYFERASSWLKTLVLLRTKNEDRW